MSKGHAPRHGRDDKAFAAGYDGIDWGRKEDPKPSGGQIWMRKSAMELEYLERAVDARQHVWDVAEALKTQPWEHEGAISASDQRPKTCQHCKHWRGVVVGDSGRACRNPVVWGMISVDEGGSSFDTPTDFSCNRWEAKV